MMDVFDELLRRFDYFNDAVIEMISIDYSITRWNPVLR